MAESYEAQDESKEDAMVHVFSAEQEAYIKQLIDKAIEHLKFGGQLLPRIQGR